MRIRIVGPVYPYKGGIAQHTTRLAHQLAEAGHDVVVESWKRQYPDALYPGQQRVDSPEGEPFPRTRFRLSWNRPDSWVAMGRRARREADLVVIVLVSPVQVPAYLVALAAMGRGRPPVAVIAHNVLPHERGPLDRIAVRALLRFATQVVVHSDAQRELAGSLTSAPAVVRPLPPHLPVAPGVSADLPAALSSGAADVPHRHLLFFGLVRHYKGADLLVRALAQVEPPVTLTIAGEFWQGATDVREAIEETGLEALVELRPGYVPAGEIPELFASADALVLPYREATATQNVALAFSYGLPVVVTDVGTLPDLVRDGEDGLVSAADDVPALAATLRRLYEPGVLDRLRAGVRVIDEQAPWDAYVAALVSTAYVAAPSRPALAPVADQPTAQEAGSMPPARSRQLAYSDLMATMLDEDHRRQKARKIIAVVQHYLGRSDLSGLRVVDVGSSGGFIADELTKVGGEVIGVDIDVPGLAKARARFGERVSFVCADGEQLPLADGSVDVLILNHIYEHVVDPDAVVDELHRVLADDGVLYLGLGNKLGVIEPHYRLPFLSYLPQTWADRYVRRFGRADHYYEQFRTRPGLRTMLRGFSVWDYTLPVIREPERFASGDVVNGPASKVPVPALRGLMPIMPAYVWVATKQAAGPRGEALTVAPTRVPVQPSR